ncbi:MAG: efflux RND transporter permease subunit [Gemmatimonadales bacterium]|nr:efflux RND transporter permease subunit [Gemmatimonadales bacterium]
MKISDVSISRPVLATMGSLALVLFGVLGYLRLPVRELPDIDPPIVSVETSLRGANPRVMESSVTDVLEEELSTAEGIRTLTSSSNEQRSSVRLEFGLSRDVESAAQDVRDLVSRVRGRLPEDVDEPVVAKQDADARPFYYLALTSTTLDLLQLNDVADRIVKQRLQTIPGVARAQIQGERRYAMKIWLDQNALTARSLTVQDVAAAIRARNVEVPAGRIESSQREFTVRSLGELRTPNEFADLVVSSQGGVLTKLRDVGRVELGPANDRSALRFDQMPGIGLGVIRQSKANVIEVSKAIQAALPSIQAALPPGVKLVQAFDQSVFVERSIRDAQRTLIEAALLVVVIIFLFLRNLRATIIPAFAIPASIIATFAVMSALGFSINNFTLLALTIAIGIVVDDAIIVLENAYRHQEELGKSPEQAARDGTREIGFAVVATTASLMAVFVPLAFLKGNTGKLFNEFGIAVAGSVFISGFVALTLTPMLCAKLLKVPPSHGRMYQLLERGFDGLATGYARVLRRSLHHPLTVVVGMLALVVGAALVFQTLKREFIPADDRGVININIVGPEGATLQYTDGYQKQVEAILAKVPEVNSVFSVIGRGGSPNGGFVVARLKYWEDRERNIEDIIAELRPKFAAIAGVQIFASNPSAIGGFGSPVQFIVRHPDYDSLLVANERLIAAARKIPGLVNVDTDLKNNKPELTIAYDRDRADDLGVPIGDVATTLQSMLGGTRVSTFTRDSRIYDVFLQLDAAHRATPQDMDQLFVRGRNGQLVRVDALASITETTGPRGIAHYERVRAFTLSASLAPSLALGDAIDSLTAIATAQLPANTTIALGGDARELSESGNELLLAFGLAILVVFMVLASQFESVVHPFTVLMAVPLAVIGAIFTLKLAGATINLYSQIGMILLVGLVTKNSILLVDYANQLRAKGMEVVDAMLEAGRIRLRPILMTSVATIMGAIPIALGSGAGATARRPLGYAIVGGIAFSTVLTLFVVPVVWMLAERGLARRRAIREATAEFATVEAP